MIARTIHSVASALRQGSWLRNPILGKEMICSSRRRRFYFLRTAYIVVMAIFVGLTWQAQAGVLQRTLAGNDVAAIASRMSEVGKSLVLAITTFQYTASVLIAVLLLSNAINGEIQRRTLPILLTTPVSFWQLALGKVLGGIWQVLVLLLISLPLLALVRVMGGVEWSIVLGSLMVTISAAFLFAAAAFHFSIVFRQSYAVMLMTILALLAYGLLAWVVWPIAMGVFVYRLLGLIGGRKFSASKAWEGVRRLVAAAVMIVLYVGWTVIGTRAPFIVFNPGYAMGELCYSLMNPGTALPGMPLYVALCSVVSIVMGFYVMSRSAKKLRGIAYTRAWGEWTPGGAQMDVLTASIAMGELRAKAARPPRSQVAELVAKISPERARDVLYGRVEKFGSCIVWKDLQGSLVRNDIVRFFLIFLPIGAVAVVYFAMLASESFRYSQAHAVIVATCLYAGGFITAIMSGMTIATERQARSWPLLQTTTLSSWEILWGKSLAIFWRAMPIWAVLAGHLLIFTLLGQLHPVAMIMTMMLAVGLNLFIIGTGLLLGTFLRQSTMAAGASLAVPVVLWLLLPPGAQLVVDAAMDPPATAWQVTWRDVNFRIVNPAEQAYVMVCASHGVFGKEKHGKLSYRLLRPRDNRIEFEQSVSVAMLVSFLTMVFYGGAGLGMGAWAASRFRRHAF